MKKGVDRAHTNFDNGYYTLNAYRRKAKNVVQFKDEGVRNQHHRDQRR
jgi:hypothetical protein